MGSTINHAWAEWWQERDSLLTKFAQTVLLLVHVGCLFAFLGFSRRSGPTNDGHQRFEHRIGYPLPWFTIETSGGPEYEFNHVVHWSSAAWLVAAAGFAFAYIYCRIEKARNIEPGFWHRPGTFLMV